MFSMSYRTQAFGIYVVMFMVILTTLVKVIVVFLILFAAFGFSFFILMSKYTVGGKITHYGVHIIYSRAFLNGANHTRSIV